MFEKTQERKIRFRPSEGLQLHPKATIDENDIESWHRNITFWFLSLANLTKSPQFGNIWDIMFSQQRRYQKVTLYQLCGMIALAFHHYAHMIRHLNRVIVSINADNWGWLTGSQVQISKFCKRNLNFIDVIKMNINFHKSWTYAMGKKFYLQKFIFLNSYCGWWLGTQI